MPLHGKDAARFVNQVRITKNTFGLGIFYLISYMPYAIWNVVAVDVTNEPVKNLGPGLLLLLWWGMF